MIYDNDIKKEYLTRLKEQAKRIQNISDLLSYDRVKNKLTDSQVSDLADYVEQLEKIKYKLLDMYQ